MPRRTAPGLTVLGLAMAAAWGLAWTRPWWLWHHYPSADLRPVLSSGGELALYGTMVPLLFALYATAAWLAGRGTSRWADAVALAAPFAFVALLLPTLPATSSDIHHYVMEGRTLWVHGQNPMTTPPSAFPDDPYLGYVPAWHRDSPSPYGPFWLLLTRLPSLLPEERPEAVLLGYKGLSAAFFLATALLLWLALAGTGAGERRRALVLYAWNPLMLLAVAVDGHNDVAPALLAVGAVLTASTARWLLAPPLLTMAALGKYVAAALAPLVLVAGWVATAHRGRRGLAMGLGVAALAAVALMAPFWEGMDTFRAFRVDQRSWFANSLPEVALLGLAKVLPLETAMGAARALGLLGFASLYALLLWRSWREGRSVTWGACQAMFLFLATASTLFYHWYVAWALPLAALLVGDVWRLPPLALSFTASFLPLIERMTAYQGFLQGDSGMRALVAVAVVLVPPLALWAWLAAREGWLLPWRWLGTTVEAVHPRTGTGLADGADGARPT
ncbi:MAG TPA: hypothetical protein VNL95_06635 [Dehalococcoidia bacterium]|nr:hypothetical protein [Dehalococcoidia bacterium]